MKKYLDVVLDFVFHKESIYVEMVSGILLLTLTFQARAYFMSETLSTGMLIAIGIMQLGSLLLFKCQQCYATRILTATAGSFAWVVVASHQFSRIEKFDGSTIATLVGSLILSATMLLAAINTIRVRQRGQDMGNHN